MRDQDRVKDGDREGSKGREKIEEDLIGLKRKKDGGAETREEG